MARGISIDTNAGQAPDVAASADVIVVEQMGRPTRFEIQIPAPVKNGDIPALIDARFDPGQPVTISADDLKFGLECLCSGEIDGQVISLDHGGVNSVLTLRGGDLTIAMDREVKVTQWDNPAMTDGLVATQICANYTMICVPAATAASRTNLGHPLVQRKTDLGFLYQLARRNNCQFWLRSMVAPVGPVAHVAHFEPISFSDGDLATLVFNAAPGLLDGHAPNTIDGIEIEFATTAPTEVKASGLDIGGVSDFTADTDLGRADSLGTTGISQIGAAPRVHRMTATGDTAADLTPKADSILSETQFFLQAYASTTVQRLGRIVRAHDTVRVQGAGSRHSGRYYVVGVTHRIDTIAHTMDLHLVRNAWGEEPGGLLGAVT